MSVLGGELPGPQAERVQQTVELLEQAGLGGARTALVLGSGLGALADRLSGASSLSFEDIEALPPSSVPGHAGRFVAGELNGRAVLIQQGRVHLYEGRSAFTVTLPVRALARLGVRNIILTNAAGGLVPGWPVPCLMRIRDHLNFQHRSPLLRSEAGRAQPYDAELGALLGQVAQRVGIELYTGVYAGLLGPSYETPAEVRLLQSAGAHAVGMSTVLEALAAHAQGLRVAAVSCISNPAAGLASGKLDHAEVVAAGKQIASDFARLLEAVVNALPA